MAIKEQLNERMVRENFWYFNEETANNFSPTLEEKGSERLEVEKKIIKGKNEHSIPRSIGRIRFKRECAFVVDWQLSDSL